MHIRMWSSGNRDNQDPVRKDNTNLFISKKFYVMTFSWILNKDKFEVHNTNLELNKLDKAEAEAEEEAVAAAVVDEEEQEQEQEQEEQEEEEQEQEKEEEEEQQQQPPPPQQQQKQQQQDFSQ